MLIYSAPNGVTGGFFFSIIVIDLNISIDFLITTYTCIPKRHPFIILFFNKSTGVVLVF